MRRVRGGFATSWVFFFFAGGIPQLHAQVTSSIQGTVTDQQGLPIVGALVVARADGTGAETKSITDSEGGFAAAGLQAGTYTITAAKDGFTTKAFDHLDLTVNRQLRLDITLSMGSTKQIVTVAATPPLLDTGTPSTGSTILPKQVESMPLNGRNYLNLLQLVPGSLGAFFAGASLFVWRKPKRKRSRPAHAVFFIALWFASTPAACPKPPFNKLVFYVVSPTSAVMIHEGSSDITPVITFIEQ